MKQVMLSDETYNRLKKYREPFEGDINITINLALGNVPGDCEPALLSLATTADPPQQVTYGGVEWSLDDVEQLDSGKIAHYVRS